MVVFLQTKWILSNFSSAEKIFFRIYDSFPFHFDVTQTEKLNTLCFQRVQTHNGKVFIYLEDT